LVSLNCNAPMQYVKYGKQYDLISCSLTGSGASLLLHSMLLHYE